MERIIPHTLGSKKTNPTSPAPAGDRWLTPPETAALFRVHPRTLGQWARTGRIPHSRTPGGHRRYRESTIHALLAEKGVSA